MYVRNICNYRLFVAIIIIVTNKIIIIVMYLVKNIQLQISILSDTDKKNYYIDTF
jgi:hypothetical protein